MKRKAKAVQSAAEMQPYLAAEVKMARGRAMADLLYGW